jgi:hypothetical protein
VTLPTVITWPFSSRRQLLFGFCSALPQVLQRFLQRGDFTKPGPVLSFR